jgi:hypothetical protein
MTSSIKHQTIKFVKETIQRNWISLPHTMSYTSLLIESAPTVCHSPLWEWKSKDSKLNSIHTTHKKVSPKMSIYKTMNQLKAFFEKAPHWLSIKIHELSIWMVSNLGRTCPFVLSLMNITMAESNSTYGIAPKWMCQRIVTNLKSFYGFSIPPGPQHYCRCRQ